MGDPRRRRLGRGAAAAAMALAAMAVGATDGRRSEARRTPIEVGTSPAVGALGRAAIELPARGSSAFRVTDVTSGLSIAARLRGARDVPREDDGARARYRGVLAGGVDEVHVPRADWTEDLVVVPAPLARPELAYEVDLGEGVAGLRQVGGVVELVDRGGAPRLRVSAPFVMDASGAKRAASIAIEGCAVDTSPRAPWGRPVVDPGARTCGVRVSWAEGLAHPIVVDPLWTTTGTLAHGRRWPNAARLASGLVLLCGGYFDVGGYGLAAELFDPATKTWATTGSLAAGREEFDLVLLDDGRALVAGGYVKDGMTTSEVETYDPASGTFTVIAPLGRARMGDTATKLVDGRVLVAGGWSRTEAPHFDDFVADAELFDPATNTWTPTAPLAHARGEHGAARLADGRVIVVGGGTYDGPVGSTELFDPEAGAFSEGPPMLVPRGSFALAVAADGRVVVAGGTNGFDLFVAAVEIFDPAASTWSALPNLPIARMAPRAALLPNGAIAVVGGEDAGNVYRTTDAVWTDGRPPESLSWMKDSRTGFTLTPLLDGRLLAAAGDSGGPYLDTAELLELSTGAAPCATSAECATGHCADGFCCDAACDGPCVACSVALRGGGGSDGQCGPIAQGTDPRGKCLDEGSPACGDDGVCDGAGACEKYPAGGSCTPRACEEGGECASGFCADGVCCDRACDGTCEACTAAKKGGGVDGACGAVARGTDPDVECASGGRGACSTRTLCDGAGTCAPANEVCAPYVCGGATGCTTTCADDAGCADGLHCVDAACTVVTPGCDGDHTVTTAAGEHVDCTPFHCGADGACKATCASIDDCVAPSVCDRAGRCVAPPSRADEAADRCTCRAPGGASAPRPGAIAGAIAAAITLAARRRRARFLVD